MRGIFLIYGTFLLLFYDSFPFQKYSIGNTSKPIYFFLLIFFFLINIDKIIKFRWKRAELIIFAFFVFSALVSYIRVFSNGFLLENAGRFRNEVIVLIVLYSSFRLFFDKASKEHIDKVAKFILAGYSFSVIFGILQWIYIFVYKFKFIETIHKYILYTTQHIFKDGRIQFLFGEPSYVGYHVLLIIGPTLVYMYKQKIKINKLAFASLLLAIPLVLSSKSVRVIVDLVVGLIIFFAYLVFSKRFTRRQNTLIAVGLAGIILSGYLFFSLNISNSQVILNRFERIFVAKGAQRDLSTWARYDYSAVGFYSLKDYPVLGYGGAHYSEAFKRNISKVDPIYEKNPEMKRNITFKYLNSINMYARFACEFGLVGLLGLMGFIIYYYKNNNSYLKVVFTLLLYELIQFDSLIFMPLIIWLAIFNSSIEKKIN